MKSENNIDIFYRAYREFLSTIQSSEQYARIKTSLKKAESDKDCYFDETVDRIIDLTWVEAIERTLPYIDKAIREQRRFLNQTDEVVPIAKSKQITTDSVRHLAQHTNMIGRVEDNKVTPKEILNIQRDESFDIYENRFLRTLILRTVDFVERCYKELKNRSSIANIKMERDISVSKEMFHAGLNLAVEYNDSNLDVNINEDVKKLTDIERIIRLRRILQDFLSAPLIRELSNSPEVRAPITRTNLLTKDINFRETLKLWEFFDNYDKFGYSVETKSGNGVISDSLKNGIYDIYALLQFIVRLNLSSDLPATLELRFNEENKRRLAEKEEAVKKRISAEVIAATEELQKKYEHEISELNIKFESEFNEFKNSCETKIKELNNKHCEEINAVNEKYTAEINGIIGKYTEEIECIKSDNEKQLNSLVGIFESKLEETESDLKAEYEGKLNETEAAFLSYKIMASEEKEKEIQKAKLNADKEIKKAKANAEKEIKKAQANAEKEIKKAQANAEKEIKKAQADADARTGNYYRFLSGFEKRMSDNNKLWSIQLKKLTENGELSVKDKLYLEKLINKLEKIDLKKEIKKIYKQ